MTDSTSMLAPEEMTNRLLKHIQSSPQKLESQKTPKLSRQRLGPRLQS
jgi:hypothetical protein